MTFQIQSVLAVSFGLLFAYYCVDLSHIDCSDTIITGHYVTVDLRRTE